MHSTAKAFLRKSDNLEAHPLLTSEAACCLAFNTMRRSDLMPNCIEGQASKRLVVVLSGRMTVCTCWSVAASPPHATKSSTLCTASAVSGCSDRLTSSFLSCSGSLAPNSDHTRRTSYKPGRSSRYGLAGSRCCAGAAAAVGPLQHNASRWH